MGPGGKISAVLLLLISAVCLFSPYIVSFSPDSIDLDSLKQPPSMKHVFGTDSKGRDILAMVLYGGMISISIAVLAGLISMTIGLVIGLMSGYFGGRLDTVFMALVDLVLAFPSLLLAIGVSVLFPPGMYTVMVALSAVGWASFARLIRGQVISLREASFIEAAKAVGCSNTRILFIHILPQCIPLAFVMTGLKLGGYILTEAGLSFLGLGAQPPTPTWGSMISSNRVFIGSAPWMVIIPGIFIAITALSFNVLGDDLREKYVAQKNEKLL
jgi:ABC-type dipeptide/oligopeptide/nickel transport system permease subunit